MTNLYLFALALLKLGMLCGFIPSIIFVCAVEAWRKAQRPARNLCRKVVSIESHTRINFSNCERERDRLSRLGRRNRARCSGGGVDSAIGCEERSRHSAVRGGVARDARAVNRSAASVPAANDSLKVFASELPPERR